MEGLIMAAQLLTGLSILVILHELGHFIAARAFGIRVDKFYLFFDAWGFKLFNIKYKDTEYGIGWLPIGGYVKMAGMIDESMDKDFLKSEPQAHEFRSKPAWQRLIVMLAGVIMNVILGVFIFSFSLINYAEKYIPTDNVTDGIYAYEVGREVGFKTGDKILSINGDKPERFNDVTSTKVFFGADVTVLRDGKEVLVRVPDTLYRKLMKSKGTNSFIDAVNFDFVISEIAEGSLAEKHGLRKGDQIIAVNQHPIESYGAFKEYVKDKKGADLSLTIKHGVSERTVNMTLDSTGILGVYTHIPYESKDYTFSTGLQFGTADAFESIYANAKGLGKVIDGTEKASESVQGPIGIAKIYGGEWNWRKFWFITGLLSMVLAFMNVLPIPALDGGHVVLTLIEMVMRRPIPEKVMENIQMVGMLIVFGLMILILGNDFIQIFK